MTAGNTIIVLVVRYIRFMFHLLREHPLSMNIITGILAKIGTVCDIVLPREMYRAL